MTSPWEQIDKMRRAHGELTSWMASTVPHWELAEPVGANYRAIRRVSGELRHDVRARTAAELRGAIEAELAKGARP